MNFDEYQRLAARTAPMDVPKPIQQATFALGLVCESTEILELFLDYQDGAPEPGSLIKELGDVLWYTAGLCTLFDLSMAQICVPEVDRAMYAPAHEVRVLAVQAGSVSDYLKKVVGHGHDIDPSKLAGGLRLVYHSLTSLCSSFDLDLGDVATANIDKLKARYPEGFSSEASINRTA